jgi:hypothetical protein
VKPKSDLYELLEAPLNAGEIELLDSPTLIEQATCLVWRGQRIDHEPGGHDDWINAAAGVVHVLRTSEFYDQGAAIGWIGSAGPRVYTGITPGWSGSMTNPALAHGPEYSGFGGVGAYRRGG